LAFQALLFYAPRLLWRLANWHSGLRILDVIQRARSTVKEGKGGKELKEREGKTFEEIGEHFTRRHDFQKAKNTRRHRDHDQDSKLWKRRSHWFSGLWGVYVTALYLFVKLLFLCNTLLQFAMLKRFLGFKDSFWGYEVLFNLINGEKWHTSGHFPRVTNCDVPVLKMSGLQKYTFQCVLSINMINERIFVFLWWWLLALAICSMFNMIYWLYISFMPGSNEDFIKKYLGYNDYKAEPSQVHDFVRNDLELDGMTLLRMIADHCGEEPTAGIVKCLWKVNHPVPQPWLMTASMLYDKSSADSMSNRTSSTIAVNDSNGIEYETKPCKHRK